MLSVGCQTPPLCYPKHRRSTFLPASQIPKSHNLIRFLSASTLSFCLCSSNIRSISVHAQLSLPTAKPDRSASIELPQWSARAIKAFTFAELEARKLKYANTGTEALLMGILNEGTSDASKFLWSNGITLFKVREETVKLLGKSNMFFSSPANPPLTVQAQRALDWAVDEKIRSGGGQGEITPTHMVLGIWSEIESAGYKIMVTLGFTDEKAKQLLNSVTHPQLLSLSN